MASPQVKSHQAWTDVIPVLQSVCQLINTDDDLYSVQETQNAIDNRARERSVEQDQIQAELKALAKKLKQAQSQLTRKPNQPTEQQHRESIQQLGKTQLSLGKATNEKESSIASKARALENLKEEYAALEKEREQWRENRLSGSDADGDSAETDGEALRLNLLQSLGYTLLPSPSNTSSINVPSAPNKILARNDAQSNITPVTLLSAEEAQDPEKLCALAGLLWGLTGSA
ncbi:Kinetochore-Ndc80 subunit Spc24 [Phaffia rhodozyma]|uniref:Kinetochore protein Spc24 n=1 Tax=Phaffia rhodozyma TaxID=264483 RepID=A0A0F7SWU3_PHARH|nr:Kinetochore-Ndc80 subunit Spc24 [Phaffia rhodozyma]